MRNLTSDEFDQLTENAITLADDEYGKKVLELTDHSIIKLFRVKRLISRATIYSPARRFARNAKRLKQLNIPTIDLIELINIKSIQRTAVHYKQLEGITVREYLQSNPLQESFLEKLGEFLALLHAKGVYFRSAHFGNIIVTPEKTFGLIDISDMSINYFSLGYLKRLRNFKHILRLKEDIELLKSNAFFENGYLNNCQIKNKKFHQKLLLTCNKLKE